MLFEVASRFAPIRGVKFLTSLLLLAGLGLSLSACNTLSTRRDLYSPTRGSGPYTKKYNEMRDQEGLFGISRETYHEPGQDEGIYGVSHNRENSYYESAEDEGIFGVSRNER